MIKKHNKLNFTLRPYQGEGVAHLLRQPHGGLLMDPGTGKTLTALAAFYELKRRKVADKLFIVAPRQVAYEVWPAEIEKWGFDLTWKILHGNNKDKLLDQADDENVDVWIINYDGLAWLFNRVPYTYWKKKKWWLMLDESTKMKNTSSGRSKTLKEYLHYFARRTILTGTPTPNGLEDLFGQVLCCDLGQRLGKYVTQFRREYFYPMGYDWRLQPDGEERVWKKLDGLFYRVSDDVLDLPPLQRKIINVTLPTKAKALYQKLEIDYIAQVENGKITAVNEGVLNQKLRQVANGVIYDDNKKSVVVHDEKMEALEDLVEELSGTPLLIGYEFTHDGLRIAKQFKAPMVYGKTPPKEASAIFKRFNNGELPVLVVQMASAAHGLNLQVACNHVCYYGQIYDYEIYDQFYKRVRRSGQKKTVFLHEIMARATVDIDIHRIVITGKTSKKVMQDRLLKSIKERYV